MFTAKVIINIIIMKKTILNFGKALNKAEQQSINGGRKQCDSNHDGVCEDSGRHCAELYCNFMPF
ncbi:hypothetical protein CXF68_08165 [Tenacibaculum sp. Bg11-29]|nr:hypothetical protein CXF68_08165 [Tenacibaculum sp. Bg11-29]